jgi:hypothetical protein
MSAPQPRKSSRAARKRMPENIAVFRGREAIDGNPSRVPDQPPAKRLMTRVAKSPAHGTFVTTQDVVNAIVGEKQPMWSLSDLAIFVARPDVSDIMRFNAVNAFFSNIDTVRIACEDFSTRLEFREMLVTKYDKYLTKAVMERAEGEFENAVLIMAKEEAFNLMDEPPKGTARGEACADIAIRAAEAVGEDLTSIQSEIVKYIAEGIFSAAQL